MKQRTKKLLIVIPTVVILILGGILIGITAASQVEEDLPALSDGVDTTPQETEAPESEPVSEPETEAPDPSSKGLAFESLGDGTCLVSGLGSCRDSELLLPLESPDGELVIGIADYAFRGETGVKGVILTPAICSIGKYAFYGSGLRYVEIPAETVYIGDYAFVGCYSLTEIKVSADNPAYSDVSGVLFNKSQSVILCYPAGRVENFYTISSKVEEIATMAFYNCRAIKLVNYVGSSSAFRTIRIGAGNEAIEEAVITYSTSSDLFSDRVGGEK